MILFFFMAAHRTFIHLSVAGHVGCFRVLAVVSGAAVSFGCMNICPEWDCWTEYICVNCSVVSDSCNSMDYSPPGSSVHEILQARILEWVAIPFSRGSS